MGGACSTYERKKRCIESWWGDLRERDHLGDPVIDERLILKWIFRKLNGGTWTGFIWLRIGASSGHLINAVMNLRIP